MSAARPGLAARVSDLLSPILVRDVVQATRGRVYGFAMAVACVSVIAIGLLAVDRDLDAFELSRWTLVVSLQCLAPLLLFAIPLMAFLSLREEVAENTADQLILTGMRPFRVILGMLLAALSQSLLFVSMFAPLFAFSYLLLGVDVWTLLQAVWLSLLASMLAATVAFALMRLSGIRALREHIPLVVLFALGWITVAVIVRADALVLWMQANARAASFWQLGLQQIALLGLAIAFLGLLGAGGLTHIKENRATSFRLLGVVAAPAFSLYCGPGMPGAAMACFLLFPFWFGAVTDPLALSPRHKPLVPKTPRKAWIMLPFLPGSGRGLIYTALLAVVTFASGVLTQLLFRGTVPTAGELLFGFVACEYMFGYAALYCLLRNHLVEQNRMATTHARLRLPWMTLLVWCAGSIVDFLLAACTGFQGFLLSIANPAWTLLAPGLSRRPIGSGLALSSAVLALGIAALVLANAADVRASVREVLHGEAPKASGPRSRRPHRRVRSGYRRRAGTAKVPPPA